MEVASIFTFLASLDVWVYVVVAAVLLIVGVFAFRRYASALVNDYVIDFGLSTADNFIAGAGAVGIDVGDWIAAIIIFTKERKINNKYVAFLVAWEATNWLPLSLIPVVGEVIEVIFNLTPSVTIARFLFNKYGKAEKAEKKLKENIELEKQMGLGTHKEQLKKVHDLIAKENPVDALAVADKSEKEVAKKLGKYVEDVIGETDQLLETIINEDIAAPNELFEMLQQAINESDQLLEEAREEAKKSNYEEAIAKAEEAKQLILQAVDEFDAELDRIEGVQ